jgi:predicted phosphodiesterase
MSSKPVRVQIPDDCTQITLCGGPYSNFGAVEAFLQETSTISHRFCLGDIGGFGPLPNRTIELLRAAQVICLQGNYDHAVGYGETDCGCGYSDPRDRHFAQVSYDYTFANTDEAHRAWLRELPTLIRIEWRDRAFLLCHGSPHQVNEFVWDSETNDERIVQELLNWQVQGICGTHTGLPWLRHVTLPTGEAGFWFNVGVLGRPAHEGKPHVYYSVIDFPEHAHTPVPRLVPLTYNVVSVVAAMKQEGLPQEFQDSLEQGIWTTCSAVLPDAERTVQERVSSLISR